MEGVRRLRALGGFVAIELGRPKLCPAEEIRREIDALAALPFGPEATTGLEGIGVATGFLREDSPPEGMATAPEAVTWFESSFGRKEAAMLVRRNAEALIRKVVGPPMSA